MLLCARRWLRAKNGCGEHTAREGHRAPPGENRRDENHRHPRGKCHREASLSPLRGEAGRVESPQAHRLERKHHHPRERARPCELETAGRRAGGTAKVLRSADAPREHSRGTRRATTRGYGQQGPPLKVGRRWLVGRPAACIRAPRSPSTEEAREQTPPPQRGIKLWVSRPGREAGAEGQGTVVAANHVRRILRANVGKADERDPPWGQDTSARGRWRGALATPSTTSSTLLGPAGALGGRFGQ